MASSIKNVKYNGGRGVQDLGDLSLSAYSDNSTATFQMTIREKRS